MADVSFYFVCMHGFTSLIPYSFLKRLKIKKEGSRGLRIKITHHTVTFDMLYVNLQTYVKGTHQFTELKIHEYTHKCTVLFFNIKKTLQHSAFVAVSLNFDN